LADLFTIYLLKHKISTSMKRSKIARFFTYCDVLGLILTLHAWLFTHWH